MNDTQRALLELSDCPFDCSQHISSCPTCRYGRDAQMHTLRVVAEYLEAFDGSAKEASKYFKGLLERKPNAE